MTHALILHVDGYAGLDRWLALLPLPLQARVVGRRWLRQTGADPQRATLVMQFARRGAYRLLDRRGRVEPHARLHLP